MQDFLKNIVENKELLWSVQIFLVIFSVLIIGFIIDNIIHKFATKFSKNEKIWDDILLKAAKRPIKVFIWIIGAILIGEFSGDYLNANLSVIIIALKNLGVVFCISWFVWQIIKEYEVHLTTNDKKVDITTAIAVMKLLKAITIITAILMIMQNLGVNISGILAFGGISGIAVGFAAKDLLANFFGAMMVYLDRPFSVGDWVRSPDRQIEGTVEYIGWRLTHIRTFDSRILYVPNSVFSTISIENPSRMSNRRINETIGVRYDDVNKVAKIIEEIRQMLSNHNEIDNNKTLMVNLNKFNEYSVDFFIYCFTKTKEWEEYHHIKQDVLLEINNIITKNKGEIAFPTSIVNIEKLDN